MDKVIEYRKDVKEDNPAHLDESGGRYFEPYLMELFAAIGLYNNEPPLVVHGLNGWVCLETQNNLPPRHKDTKKFVP